MKHKVVFCFHTNAPEYSMGIGFISACLKQAGQDVDLVIYREITGKQVDTPDEIANQIIAKQPTVVAFSVMTFGWRRIQEVIRLVRPKFNGLIVVGGYHAILNPLEVLSYTGVDAVCTGEGELPMMQLLECWHDRFEGDYPIIQGMIFKDKSANSATSSWLMEDLSAYPYMDYSLFHNEGNTTIAEKNLGFFSPAGLLSLPVITGRGCPYRCTYCSNSALIDHYGGAKRFLRKYDPPTIIAHLKTTVEQYRPQFLEFHDETFTLNNKWIREFCSAYKTEIGLPFSIFSRINRIDDDTLGVLVDSGLSTVFFGLECGDEEYRTRYLKRMMSDETIKRGAALLKKHGVIIVTFNIFGMPFETTNTIRKTYELNGAIDPDVAMAFIYQPLPCTELAKLAFDHNLVLPPPEGVWDFCTPSLDTAELPAKRVATAVDEFRQRFCSPEKVQSVFSRLREIANQS